jgi:3-oxoacyl-[acyl-carrier protein] reductase
MPDTYTQIATNPFGRKFIQQLGLPAPVLLERHEPGDPVVEGTVLLGAAPGGRLAGPIATVLEAVGADAASELRDDLRSAAADAGLDASVWNPAAPGDQRFKALVFDATGITDSTQLRELHAFFQPSFRRMVPCGRVIVLGTPVADAASPREATAQRALEGFVRSAAKEARDGTTAQLVYVAPAPRTSCTRRSRSSSPPAPRTCPPRSCGSARPTNRRRPTSSGRWTARSCS